MKLLQLWLLMISKSKIYLQYLSKEFFFKTAVYINGV
jgi:hypothetical protein